MGRAFSIVAAFSDDHDGTRQANAYMARHADVGVLEVVGGKVILAALTDRGTPV